MIRWIQTEDEVFQVVMVHVFDSSAHDLWDACTNTARLAIWFEPEVGDLVLGGGFGMPLSGTEVRFGSAKSPDRLRYNISKVEVELIPVTDVRTLLRVSHHVPPDEHWDSDPATTGIGWEGWLRALALHLAGNSGGSPEELEAFVTTPDGQNLIRSAADAWALVDQEAGTAL